MNVTQSSAYVLRRKLTRMHPCIHPCCTYPTTVAAVVCPQLSFITSERKSTAVPSASLALPSVAQARTAPSLSVDCGYCGPTDRPNAIRCADATLPTGGPQRPCVLQAHCGRSATVELAEANAWRNFGNSGAHALHRRCITCVRRSSTAITRGRRVSNGSKTSGARSRAPRHGSSGEPSC